MTNSVMNYLKKWMDHEFLGTTTRTEDYIQFEKGFRNAVNREAKKHGYHICDFMPGHFECSMFLKNDESGQYYFVSINDVRFDPIRNAKILFRTAKDNKDFCGGYNQFAYMNSNYVHRGYGFR